MKNLIEKATQDFTQHFGQKPSHFSQAPGRINIIGEHTDYAGGLSLPAAIDCWTVAAWRQREDSQIKIFSNNMQDFWSTSWKTMAEDITQEWQKYVAGALILFKQKRFPLSTPPGLEISLLGNVPLGKGLSSSASVELAVLNGANLVLGQNLTALDMSLLAQQVEHQFLKVKSGLLDQFASQFSKKESALLIDFVNLRTQTVQMSPAFQNYVWILVDSHVKRELASSKYSERVDEYQQALAIAKTGGKKSMREIQASELKELYQAAPANVAKRARHIVTENERTLNAFNKLESGDVKELGQLLYETHHSLSADCEVSHPHLDFLVETAKRLEGVMGGRMMGGGFGGCALFLVHKDFADVFSQKIAMAYEKFCQVKTEPRAYRFVDGASAWRGEA